LIPSRAGQDAMHLMPLADAGMIFLPNGDGIGHDSGGWTEMKDVEKGSTLLAEFIVELAARE
jgi:acetylornithine deacetylase/succinyl-diaminopimelate desuccinylase-like protein